VDNVSGKDGQFYLSFPEYAQGVLDSLDAVMGIGQNSYEHLDHLEPDGNPGFDAGERDYGT